MARSPGYEGRYFSLWLDYKAIAGGKKSGYELRFTDHVATHSYEVTLSKWQSGEETKLASKSSYAFEAGDSFALVDEGNTVSAWTDTGSGVEELRRASQAPATTRA
jgi:hypothetical protein